MKYLATNPFALSVCLSSRAPQDIDVFAVRALVLVLKFVADVLVFAHGLGGWLANFRDINSRTLRAGTRTWEVQDGEDVDVVRRPAVKFDHPKIRSNFS